MDHRAERPREQAGSSGGLAGIPFGHQQRQRVITRCALSVERSESATVIRSTSVVLSRIALSEGLTATRTLGLLGQRAPDGAVS